MANIFFEMDKRKKIVSEKNNFSAKIPKKKKVKSIFGFLSKND